MQVLAADAVQAGSLPGTISAARSSLASRNGCTGSLANAMFDVKGPTRPSSGMPETSASTANASLIVARYSARVRRANPDCRLPGATGCPPAPPVPEDTPPAPLIWPLPPIPTGPGPPAEPESVWWPMLPVQAAARTGASAIETRRDQGLGMGGTAYASRATGSGPTRLRGGLEVWRV